MLIPLTRKKFEELIPIFATGGQYKYYWGKPSDFLRRFLFSLTAVVAIVLIEFLLGGAFRNIFFMLGFATAFYWLWSPIFFSTQRNLACRRYKYSGFLQAEVLDVFFSEELIGTEETVNKRGDLVVIENRERCLNLEIGDDSGFGTKIQVPLQREHRGIRPGDRAALVVMSDRRDLSLISKISDVYLLDYDLWVSDYPYLQRQIFAELCQRMERSAQDFDDSFQERRSDRFDQRYDDYSGELGNQNDDRYGDRFAPDEPYDRFDDPGARTERYRNRSRGNRANPDRQSRRSPRRPPLQLDSYPDDLRDN
jgi:hypothetical protein